MIIWKNQSSLIAGTTLRDQNQRLHMSKKQKTDTGICDAETHGNSDDDKKDQDSEKNDCTQCCTSL